MVLQEEALSCKPIYVTFNGIVLTASLTGETYMRIKKIVCASFTFIHSEVSLMTGP
jgi:hypothetical protein